MLNAISESKQVNYCLFLWGFQVTRKVQSGSHSAPQLAFWGFSHHKQGVPVQNRLQSESVFLLIHGWGMHSCQSRHFWNGWLCPQYTHVCPALLIILHGVSRGQPGMAAFGKHTPNPEPNSTWPLASCFPVGSSQPQHGSGKFSSHLAETRCWLIVDLSFFQSLS